MQLTITIQNEASISAIIVDTDAKFHGKVDLDTLRRQTIEFFRSWLESDGPKNRKGLKVLGSHLYHAIFNGEIDECFVRALNECRQKGEKLRVKLCFDEDAVSLANFPWEFLYRHDSQTSKGYFLSTETKLTLSRYMPVGMEKKTPAEQTALKVLVVFAEPHDGSAAGDGNVRQKTTVIDDMKNMFGELGKLNIQIEFLDKDKFNVETLSERLNKVNPHVLHFIGHGMINNKTNVSQVGILSEDNNYNRLTLTEAEFFASSITSEETRAQPSTSNLRLVCLQLSDCQHPEIDPKQYTLSFAGVAPALILAGIPAVVAMQFPMESQVARLFFRGFYEQLAGGESIDRAVQFGRQKISSSPAYQESHIFGTPILFMNVAESIVLAPEMPKPESERGRLDNKLLNPAPDDQASGTQTSQTVSAPGAGTINVIALTKVASRAMAEVNLSREGKNDMGKIYDKLFAEKECGRHLYRQVLLEERLNNSDPDVKLVISAMLDELTKMEGRNA